MRFFKLSSPCYRFWVTTWVLSLAASMAAAQGSAASSSPAVHRSGTVVTGRVSEPTSETIKSVPAPTAAAAPESATAAAPTATSPSATEAATDVPAATATTSPVLETSVPTTWAREMVRLEPLVNNPVAWAGALLALMGVLALGVYRRNRRADALGPTSAPLPPKAQPVLMDPLLLPQGLQAEIMALDLELGPSEAPASTSAAPLRPTPAPLSGADLRLSKLQWAQQLLAAGENELARALLTSVAESLQSQLQQRGDAPQGPRQ